jgi:hypothetical protein
MAVQEEYAPDGRVVSLTAGTTTVPTIPSVNLGGGNAGPASRAAPSGSAGGSSGTPDERPSNGSGSRAANVGSGALNDNCTPNDNCALNANGAPNDNENGEPNEPLAADVDKLWQREDAEDWTEELTRAHRAFERGRGWGVEWALLMDRFYNFETAWGYTDTGGGAITTTGCPKAMEHWLVRARKWEKTVDIGVLGDTKSPGTFVSLWWDW